MLKTKNPRRDDCRRRPGAAGIAGMALLLAVLAGCQPPGPAALLEGRKLLEQGQPAAALGPLSDATAILKTNALAWSFLGLAQQQCGRLAEATNAYGLALRYNRDLTEVHFNLGCALLDLGKFDAARTEFTAYTLRQTRDPLGWFKLGQVQLRLRDLVGAERSFAESLRLKPTNAPALDGLGQTRLQRGNAREAAQYFAAASRTDPACRPALRNLALVEYQNLRNYPAALAAFREYAALIPPPPDAAVARALVRDLEARLAPWPPATNPPVVTSAPPAVSHPTPTNPVVSAPPKPVATNQVAARPPHPPVVSAPPPTNVVSPSPHRPELAVVQLPDSPDLKPAVDAPVEKPGSPAAVAETTTPPVPTAEAASAPPKKGFFAKLNPLNLFRKKPKTAGTTPEPVPTPETAPVHEPAAPMVTPLPSETGPATAREPSAPAPAPAPAPTPVQVTPPAASAPPVVPRYAYRRPARPSPGDRAGAVPLFNAAIQAQRSGQTKPALEDYRKATQFDPAFYEAWYNLALAATALGNTAEGLLADEFALALKPDSTDARYNFALALRDAGYWLDAAAELEKLLAQNPADVRAHLAAANLYAQKLRQPASARAHYLKVVELDPRNAQAPNIRDWLLAHPV